MAGLKAGLACRLARGRAPWLAGALAGWALVLPAAAQTIFACEPEWAALTRVLLPAARIHVATHAHQDPHHIEARPALIAQLRTAEAAICTGASLESGWLPVLQQRAANPRVQAGAPGLFFAAEAVTLLDPRPQAWSHPFAGDVHPEGNPHLHADPRNLLPVARAWSGRLQQLFPEQRSAIAQRHDAFAAQWAARIAGWEQRAGALRGARVAAQHASFAYLWHWLGVQQVADLEPKPGLAPTPAHLQRLLGPLRAAPPAAIVVGSHQDPRAARWLGEQLGRPGAVVQLPGTVEDPQAPDALGQWFERLLNGLDARKAP